MYLNEEEFKSCYPEKEIKLLSESMIKFDLYDILKKIGKYNDGFKLKYKVIQDST